MKKDARGSYDSHYYDETSRYIHSLVVEGEAGCCPQGVEFKWNGEHTYPDDYPVEMTQIELTGIFERYEELGFSYYCLVVDDISILSGKYTKLGIFGHQYLSARGMASFRYRRSGGTAEVRTIVCVEVFRRVHREQI